MTVSNSIAKEIAYEDIRPGMFIAVLFEMEQIFECDGDVRSAQRPQLPWDVDPYQVQAVCLPYLLVRKPGNERETLDVRRCRFARLSADFGRVAFTTTKATKGDDED